MLGILNLDRQFVFIHIPKTAGSSVTVSLQAEAGSIPFSALEGIREALVEYARKRGQTHLAGPKHATTGVVRDVIGEDRFDALESLITVRNPWDRLRSHFRYRRKIFMDGAKIGPLPPNFAKGFEHFVLWFSQPGRRQCCDWVFDEQGNRLVKTIIRSEELDDQFPVWAEKHLDRRIETKRENVSKEEIDMSYTEEMIGAVRSTFADDIARFDYPDRPDVGI